MSNAVYTIRRLSNRPTRRVGTKLTRASSLKAVGAMREIESLANANGGLAGKSYVVPGETLEVAMRLIDWGFTYSTPFGSNTAGCEDA